MIGNLNGTIYTPCHGAATQGEDGSRTVPGAKLNLARDAPPQFEQLSQKMGQ